MSGAEEFSTDTYAFVSGSYKGGVSGDVVALSDVVGTARITSDSAKRVFVGIARPVAVDHYLGSVHREQGQSFTTTRSDYTLYGGGAPSTAPAAQHIWAASMVGSGEQVLTWKAKSGDWKVVLMNADGSAGVSSTIDVGGKFPDLLWYGIGALGAAAVLLVVSGALIYGAVPKVRASADADDSPAGRERGGTP
jgi:hypothetical protein